MKNMIFVLLISASYLFGYNLQTGFLQPGSYTLEYGDDLLKNENWNALNLAVGLTSADIDSAIIQLYRQLSDVDGKPAINFSPTVNSSAQCKITYAYLSNNAIMECVVYENCGFTSFEIRVNTEIHYNSTWNNQYGWNTHINLRSVLKHELGHALGLDDIYDTGYSDVLMYGLNDVADVVTTVDLTPKNDDINGFTAVYEVPSLQIMNPYIADGDTLRVFYENNTDLVNFRVTTPNMLEYNSVTPPDLIPKGYFVKMDNSYSGLEATLQAQGDDIYTYQISVENLTSYIESNSMKFRSFIQRGVWEYSDYRINYSPCDEKIIQFIPKPTIDSPAPGGIYNVRSRGKGAVTDTLEIKVRVPEVLGSYPAINIKIDGTYVSQGDITFDSTEDVWIYNWDLSTTNPTELGTRYNIVAEIDGDPTSYAATEIFLVEAIFNEDFETMTSLPDAGWGVYTWQTPDSITQPGWFLGNKVYENNNGLAMSITKANQTYIGYRMWSPVINLPSVASGTLIKLKYRFYFDKTDGSSLYSLLKFAVSNSSGTAISAWSTLPGVDESWVDMEYDLTTYAGQSIKLQWFNNYLTGPALPTIEYDVDDIIVYQTIDTSSPAIDFIAGNSAELDEDMNLNIGFSDNSSIGSVTADYSIEDDSNTITLYPVKGSFNYTGSISARDHICEGSISFKIKDSVGNETVSAGHSISWGTGSILTSPENVVITQPTSTSISITWDIVDGATAYKVYSSTDPYGTFTEDTTGTFTESRKWEKTIDGTKYFYYIVATNALKKENILIENGFSDR